MREEERVYLPSRLSEKWDDLEIDVFEAQAEQLNRETPLSSVAGDVYELTMDDVKQIVAMPGQVTNIIRLTDPYNRYQSSFVTIPLSGELRDLLLVNREKLVE